MHFAFAGGHPTKLDQNPPVSCSTTVGRSPVVVWFTVLTCSKKETDSIPMVVIGFEGTTEDSINSLNSKATD